MSLWICADVKPSASQFYFFSKSFDADAGATLTARVCGDSRYQLYLNGHIVSEGPCQGSEYQTYYEEVDLTPFLVAGENKLIAKVMYLVEGDFISIYRRSKPAMWFDGTLTVNGSSTEISTDESWICEREDGISFHHCAGLHPSMPPFETVHGVSKRAPVTVKAMYAPDLGNKCFNPFGLSEQYILTPRPIPQMELFPAREMKIVRRGEGFIEFDAGSYTTAKVYLNLQAKAGTQVRLIYAECYTLVNENGHGYKERRDNHSHETSQLTGAYDIITATGEKQVFEPFWYRSFRYIRVEFDADATPELLELTYGSYFYPIDHAGTFTCSDERLNQMWAISRNTLLCCTHEMYVDCPYYEQQQYQMDSCLEMLYTFRLTADNRMPFKSVTDLGHSQLADGMLQANYPSNFTQIIPGFTLFWILMLREYLRYAGGSREELARVRALSGTVDKALECFEANKTPEGLIGPTPYWTYVDWVPTWPYGIPVGGRTEPVTVTCMMYAAALEAAAQICDTVGRPGTAQDYRARAAQMIDRINEHCYDKEQGLYRDTPSTQAYSQHTTVWAVLSGAVKGEEAGKLVDRTFNADIPLAQCCFSMNHYMFRALELANRYEYAPKQMEGWQKMLDLHCTTWCENPDWPRSECHAWSSAPIYEFSEMIIGVYPTENGYNAVRIKPHVDGFGLTWAKGTVPTPHGNIAVEWEKKDGALTLSVSLPTPDMRATVVLPDGQSVEMEGNNAAFSCAI